MSIFATFYESVTDGRTDGPMDRRTDRPSYRDARTHLKIWIFLVFYESVTDGGMDGWDGQTDRQTQTDRQNA